MLIKNVDTQKQEERRASCVYVSVWNFKVACVVVCFVYHAGCAKEYSDIWSSSVSRYSFENFVELRVNWVSKLFKKDWPSPIYCGI